MTAGVINEEDCRKFLDVNPFKDPPKDATELMKLYRKRIDETAKLALSSIGTTDYDRHLRRLSLMCTATGLYAEHRGIDLSQDHLAWMRHYYSAAQHRTQYRNYEVALYGEAQPEDLDKVFS